ncbi:hypothetical protein [Bradyrhizobium sp. URHD0069]|uniref:hypothetical protein n=1 Tax=Bradyrhizobium sp. URHD0069 TaxID=1380355 RepID=UPI00049866DC|nr:hypothetical protein [Bradyrhizobium sp. URHD0069]
MLEKPYIATLTGLIVLLIVILSVRKFHVLAIARNLSEYPKDARSWTTPYNFVFSAILYVSLATIVFATLDNLPDLTIAIISAFSKDVAKASEDILEGSLERLAADSTREWVAPILAGLATIALFGFEKSPLAFADRSVREILQLWASIPTKVRTMISQLEEAEFGLPLERRVRVLSHIAEHTRHDADFMALVDDKDLKVLLLRAGSLDLLFQEWKNSESAFNDLYRDNEELTKLLSTEFNSIAEVFGYYLALLKSPEPDNAEAQLDRGKRSVEIKERLSALIKRQYLPFCCGILQSSRNSGDHRKFLSEFGFRIKDRVNPSAMFRYMLEDMAQMVFFLVVTIYPLVYFIARYRGWKPDNTFLDTVFVWPCQLAILAIASVLPVLIWQRSVEKQELSKPALKRRRVGHFLAYLVIAITGGLMAVLMITILSLLSASMSSLPQMIGLKEAALALLKVAPFGLVAAAIGMITAILIDIPLRFPFRFVLDGLATGVIAAALAVVAVVAQTNVDVESYFALLTFDSEAIEKNPGLKILRFVLPVVFATGLCVGLIIPRGYRHYRDDLVARSSEI